jgi:hypothetical protein
MDVDPCNVTLAGLSQHGPAVKFFLWKMFTAIFFSAFLQMSSSQSIPPEIIQIFTLQQLSLGEVNPAQPVDDHKPRN